MKVLFWVPYPTEGASNRYRVEQYLSFLKSEGIGCALRPFWSTAAYRKLYERKHYFRKLYFFLLGTINRISDIIHISRYDIVFIQRQAYPIGGLFFERILSLLGKPFIFDFDDAIFLPASSSQNSFIEKFRRPEEVSKLIAMSNHVIAGNYYLAEFATRYNKNVSIIPTCIDTDKYYPFTCELPIKKIVIGWIGSVTTAEFISILKDTFSELSKRKNIIFKVIGGDLNFCQNPGIINISWSIDEEIKHLKTFDIGIMPMPDNEWTRGKCGFKAILYMSMGIPCVCSPVGVNKEIIKDGINGFFADKPEEWIDKLSLLIDNAELRKKIGLAGRKTIEEKFSVKLNAPKMLEIFKQVFSERSGE